MSYAPYDVTAPDSPCPTAVALMQRLGRPTQPQLAAVRAVTDPLWAEYVRRASTRRAARLGATIDSRISEAPYAREAWETLVSRGLLPPGWLDDPRRRFVDPRSRSSAPNLAMRQPTTLGFVRALAAAMPGPLLVEELAAEAYLRARAWVATPRLKPLVPRRVRWRLTSRRAGAGTPAAPPDPLRIVWNALQPRSFPQGITDLGAQASVLELLRARRLEVAEVNPRSVAATEPDPLGPLRDALCHGFVVGMDAGATLELGVPGES